MSSTHLRYLVAASGVLIGIALAIWDFSTVSPTLPRAEPGSYRRTTPEEDRALFDACVTLFACAYGVGNVGYRLLGHDEEAEELRRWSKWHMLLLHAAGGTWLFRSAWLSFRDFNLIRPAGVVGAVLLAMSVLPFILPLQPTRRDER